MSIRGNWLTLSCGWWNTSKTKTARPHTLDKTTLHKHLRTGAYLTLLIEQGTCFLFNVIQANIYRWRSNFADSRLLCNRTYLGDVAQRILKLLPWWLKHWTLRRRHKLFPFHCPGNNKIDNASLYKWVWLTQLSYSIPISSICMWISLLFCGEQHKTLWHSHWMKFKVTSSFISDLYIHSCDEWKCVKVTRNREACSLYFVFKLELVLKYIMNISITNGWKFSFTKGNVKNKIIY